jgi:hypothetical protein
MITLTSAPEIDGLAEVANFVNEHAMLDSILAVYEITTRQFPEATRIRVERQVDPEDGEESVFFVIAGVNLPNEELSRRDIDWSRQVVNAIPGDHVWRIGHEHE